MAARFDLTSDYMIFFMFVFVLLAITVVAMERYSPGRKSKRKVRRHTKQQSGDLID